MQLQEAIAEIIAAVQATAILVTHDIEEALYLADRIVVLGGSPSRIALEITIPPHKRRNRDANLNSERSTLFHALSGEEIQEQESA
jgi:ABC-type nitrate/sulfonate/bicarbonate transport system ATPase subunit